METSNSISEQPIPLKSALKTTSRVSWYDKEATLSNSTKSQQEYYLASKPQVQTKSSPRLHLGIYLDENLVTIGVNESKHVEKIKSYPPEITFFDEKILIGKQTEEDYPYFNIYELLKSGVSEQTTHAFTLLTSSFNLSNEEIASLYFKKILSKIRDMKEGQKIGNIVIVIPWATTAFERERVKNSMTIAGYDNVRIYSSVLTTALWSLVDEDHFTHSARQTKLILVVHTLKYGFSLAILQVNHRGLVIKSCIVSENLKECQDQAFFVGHGQMFSKEGKHIDAVLLAYKAGIDQLLIDISGQPIDQIIGWTKPRYSETLKRILTRFFGESLLKMVGKDEPLSGGCMIASRNSLPANVFPPDFNVRDAFRTNLIITGGGSKSGSRTRNGNFLPGTVTSFSVPIPSSGITEVAVYEEYFKGGAQFLQSKYSVTARVQKPEKAPEKKKTKATEKPPEVKVDCYLDLDEDGVLLLNPQFPENVPWLEKKFVRVDQVKRKVTEELERFDHFYKQPFRKPTVERHKQNPDLVQMYTNEAVLFYSMSMKTFNPRGKSEEEIKEEHDKVKLEAQQRFQENCEKSGVDPKTGLPKLDKTLDNVFQDFKKFISNSKAKVTDWFNQLFSKGGKSKDKNNNNEETISDEGQDFEDIQKRYPTLNIREQTATSTTC